MTKFIVLLRGVNVSGKNKLPMQDLRDPLKNREYQNVQTYIQSGNVILETTESKSEVSQNIHKAIQDAFGYDIAVLVKTIPELERAISKYPFSIENPKIVAFVFLNQPSSFRTIEIKGVHENDKYLIDGDMVYLYCPSSFAKTKLTNNTFEIRLNAVATTRNYRTTIKLLELAIN